MAHSFDVTDFLDDHGIGFQVGSGGNELILDQCPTCGKSNKFYISVNDGRFICFHCSSTDEKMRGGPYNLVMVLADVTFREAKRIVDGREIHVPIEDDEIGKLLDFDTDSFTFNQTKTSSAVGKKVLPHPIRVPRYMLPIGNVNFPEAWSYLSGRGIDDGVIQKMDVLVSGLDTPKEAAEVIARGESPHRQRVLVSLIYDILGSRVEINDANVAPFLKEHGVPETYLARITDAVMAIKYRGRVVFTVRISGLVFGWVARNFRKPPGEGQFKPIKVLNSPGPFKYFCLWNFDRVVNAKEIVVCEGIVSAVKCGIDRGVATLGKMVTDEQLRLLRKTKAETIIICLDVDAQAEAFKLKRRLLASFKSVYNVKLPPVKLISCPSCGISHEVDVSVKLDKIVCTCGSEVSGQPLYALLMQADYKDAGDYSPPEMDYFIAEAKKTDQDGFLLGESAFED
jgi:hypothetical protein